LAITAPLWASLAHDPGKSGLLALAAAIAGIYAFYTVFIGSANGKRQFHKQAALDVTSATLRAGGIVAAAALGLGVWGVIGAWVAASATVLVIATVFIGWPRGVASAGNVAPMARYLGGIAVYLVLINLIMTADQLLLKRLAAEWFHAHPERLLGETLPILEAAAKHADGQVGFYRAAQTFARLPYQLMLAVTFVVFPLVSRSTFENDLAKTRGYIRATMRYSLIFAGLMGAVLASNAQAILKVPFPKEFAVGGMAMSILSLGNVAFALFTIACTILNGAGRTREAIAVAVLTLALLAAGLWIGIPRAEPGEQMLTVCATATAGAMLLGALVSGGVLLRVFGAFLPPATLLRVVLATAAALGVGRAVGSRGPIVTVLGAAAAGLVFVGVLVITREIGKADLANLGRVVRRKP
jgi:stage V sporulation protein B